MSWYRQVQVFAFDRMLIESIIGCNVMVTLAIYFNTASREFMSV